MTNPRGLVSDAVYNLAPFDDRNQHPSTGRLNNAISKMQLADKKWWEIGAAEYRKLAAEGKGVFPVPPQLARGETILAKSSPQDAGAGASAFALSARIIRPQSEGKMSEPRGIYYHIHGGGFVLGDNKMQDELLAHIADSTQLVVVSVEYRLAPEHPWPAARHDCENMAVWLIENGRQEFGCELKFVGGESAGGTLSMFVLLHLRHLGEIGKIEGAVLNYGCYDLSLLPSALSAPPETPFLSTEQILHYREALLPNEDAHGMKRSDISPMYNDLSGLGSALFLTGTGDALLDDSVLMHFRWLQAGNHAIIKFLPGAPHGFMMLNGHDSRFPVVTDGWKIMIDYIQGQMEGNA